MITNEQRAIWAELYVLAGLWTKKDESILLLNAPDYTNDVAACFRDFEPMLIEKYRLVQIAWFPLIKQLWLYFDGGNNEGGRYYETGKGNTYSEAFTAAVDKIIPGQGY